MRELRKHTVFPGQHIITSVPSLITTVLGSCVAVCIWDQRTHLGGMNHYLLPGSEEGDHGNPNRGISATRMLIRSMLNRGASAGDMIAKVFGGCNSLYRNNDLYRVGERNIAVALGVVTEFCIPVRAQHTGGTFGRKIVFNSATGKVRMRLLTKSSAKINEEINKGFGY